MVKPSSTVEEFRDETLFRNMGVILSGLLNIGDIELISWEPPLSAVEISTASNGCSKPTNAKAKTITAITVFRFKFNC